MSPFAYVTRGRYADQLARWTGRFDVHIQFLEEIRTDSARLGALYGWLGVGDDFRPEGGSTRTNASTVMDEPLDPRLVEELREYYAASDAAVTELLGRPVPWRARQNV